MTEYNVGVLNVIMAMDNDGYDFVWRDIYKVVQSFLSGNKTKSVVLIYLAWGSDKDIDAVERNI